MCAGRVATILLCLTCLLPATSQAQAACGQAALKDEHQDVTTIQALERAWSVAFLQGDTDFERCLLTSDFTEITRSGAVKVLADELLLAAQNRGKNLPPPPPLQIPVMIHGDVAVAYVEVPRSKDGKTFTVYNADYYVWERGGWHAYFSQQTQF
ncbi:MAG TPA: hypothetical protein VGH91_08620 [Gammaproteobacteria bacterium]|jgi:hypothetical protein